LEEDNLIN